MCLARAEAARAEMAARSNDSRPVSRDHGHTYGRVSSERQSFSRQSSPLRFLSEFAHNGHAQSHPVAPIPNLPPYRPEPIELSNWDPAITGFNLDSTQTFDNFTNLQFPDNWEDWEDLIDRLTTTMPGANGGSFGNGDLYGS